MTEVPQATQGSPSTQDTEQDSDASLTQLTGEKETPVSNSTYPTSPFSKPGMWIFSLLMLSCLGVAGVVRACAKGSVPV